jgi:hypothetical protein
MNAVVASSLVHAVPCLFHRRTDMFKISTIDTRFRRTLVVEGKLIEPWVGELRETWKRAAEDLDGRKRIIDLANVTVISKEGEDAIFDLMRVGAKFSCGGVLTRHVVRQLEHRCHERFRKMLGKKQSGGATTTGGGANGCVETSK